MKQLLLGSVCALACAALSTMSAQASVSGSVSADYNYNAWDSSDYSMGEVRGAILTDLGYDNLSAQANAQYQYVGSDNSIGTFSGSLFWTGQESRIAVTVQNEQWEGFDPWSAGIGAEVFISPEWTLAAHAGAWWQAYSSQYSGGYAGAKATYYWNPNLALSGQIDYSSLPDYYYGQANDVEFTARAEYLWCDDLAVFGGYTYGDVGSSPVNAFTIGLKYYVGDNSATTLVDHHRTGEMDYPVTFQPIWFHH